MNERLITLCEKLAGSDELIKAQISHRAPAENLVPIHGRRSWAQIRTELEQKSRVEPKQGASKEDKNVAGADLSH